MSNRLDRGFCALIVLLVGSFAVADEVKFAETTTVLPTYAPGGYDKTPLFYTGRVVAGAIQPAGK